MAKPAIDRLTGREREIVETLFALSNRASAENIRQRLTDPPSYSAVRALLARLEQRGWVKHVHDGQPAVCLLGYHAPSDDDARRTATQSARVF